MWSRHRDYVPRAGRGSGETLTHPRVTTRCDAGHHPRSGNGPLSRNTSGHSGTPQPRAHSRKAPCPRQARTRQAHPGQPTARQHTPREPSRGAGRQTRASGHAWQRANRDGQTSSEPEQMAVRLLLWPFLDPAPDRAHAPPVPALTPGAVPSPSPSPAHQARLMPDLDHCTRVPSARPIQPHARSSPAPDLNPNPSQRASDPDRLPDPGPRLTSTHARLDPRLALPVPVSARTWPQPVPVSTTPDLNRARLDAHPIPTACPIPVRA